MNKIKQSLISIIILLFWIMSIIDFFGAFKFNIALSDLFVILLGIIYLIDIRQFRFKKDFPHWWYFFLLLVALFISNIAALCFKDINAVGTMGIVSEIIKFLIIGVYFFVGYNSFSDQKSFNKIIKIWIIGLWLNIMLGLLVQFNYFLGNNILWHNTISTNDRFLGGFTDANLAGTYLTLSFFIVIIFIKLYRSKIYQLVGFITLVLTVFCIFMTQSRGSLAGFLVALGLYTLWNIKKLYKLVILILPLLLIVYFGFVDVDYTLFDESLLTSIEERLESAIQGEGQFLIRKNLSLASLRMGLDHPLLGVGRGNFILNSKPYIDELYDKRDDFIYNESIRSLPHNTFAGIFAEMGLIGLTIFSSIFILLLYKMWNNKNKINTVFFFALIGFGIQSLVLSLENFRGLWLLMGILFILQEIDIDISEEVQGVNINRGVIAYGVISLMVFSGLYIDVARKIPKKIVVGDEELVYSIDAKEQNQTYLLEYSLEDKAKDGTTCIQVYEKFPDGTESLLYQYQYTNANGIGKLSLERSKNVNNYIIKLKGIYNNENEYGKIKLSSLRYKIGDKVYPLHEYKYMPTWLEKIFIQKQWIWKKDIKYSIVEKSFPVWLSENIQLHDIKVNNEDITFYMSSQALVQEDKSLILEYQVDNINKSLSENHSFMRTYLINPKTSTWEIGKEYEFTIPLEGSGEDYKLQAYLNGSNDKKFPIGIFTPDSDSLVDYLNAVTHNQLVLISIKDEGTVGLTPEVTDAMRKLGFECLLKGKYRWSYLAIGGKIEGIGVIESLDDAALELKLNKGSKLGNITIPFELHMKSAGFDTGNISSIVIDGHEYSQNGRGMNIVVYDLNKKEVVDSTYFDTHLSIYR